MKKIFCESWKQLGRWGQPDLEWRGDHLYLIRFLDGKEEILQITDSTYGWLADSNLSIYSAFAQEDPVPPCGRITETSDGFQFRSPNIQWTAKLDDVSGGMSYLRCGENIVAWTDSDHMWYMFSHMGALLWKTYIPHKILGDFAWDEDAKKLTLSMVLGEKEEYIPTSFAMVTILNGRVQIKTLCEFPESCCYIHRIAHQGAYFILESYTEKSDIWGTCIIVYNVENNTNFELTFKRSPANREPVSGDLFWVGPEQLLFTYLDKHGMSVFELYNLKQKKQVSRYVAPG